MSAPAPTEAEAQSAVGQAMALIDSIAQLTEGLPFAVVEIALTIAVVDLIREAPKPKQADALSMVCRHMHRLQADFARAEQLPPAQVH